MDVIGGTKQKVNQIEYSFDYGNILIFFYGLFGRNNMLKGVLFTIKMYYNKYEMLFLLLTIYEKPFLCT